MKNILLILLILLVGLRVTAQPDPALSRYLDSLLKPYNNKNSPGLAISILQNGKPIVRKTAGMASIELQVPFMHQSVVRIGYSEAREFISIAAVLMEKDGIFSLNDKVRKYFPKLPEWSEPVTIWDLLNHRSGFVDEWATALLMHGAMFNRFDKEQFFRLLYRQPEPEVEPGKGYMYCNSDFGLLRLIMEKASGKNLSDWIKQRVFDPIKMSSTRMQRNPLEIIPNKASKYSHSSTGGFELENVQKTSPGGNYFILTCGADLEKWASAVNDQGSEISKAYKKLLDNVRMIPGKKNHYVTGYSTDTINGHPVVFHEGVNTENYLTRIPSKGLSIITLGNKDGDGFSEQNKLVCQYLVGAKKPAYVKPVFLKKPVPVTEEKLKKYEGRYRWLNKVSWQSYNEERKTSDFFVENGKLKLRYSGNFVIGLIPVGEDIFYYEEDFGAQIKFTQPEGHTTLKVDIAFDDGFPGETMMREAGKLWSPSVEDLKKYAGSYYSGHLEYHWNFELNEQGKMILRRATMPDAMVEPEGENQFHYIAEKSPGAGFDQWILFSKNAAGEVTGLMVWSNRVMHHRFEKVN